MRGLFRFFAVLTLIVLLVWNYQLRRESRYWAAQNSELKAILEPSDDFLESIRKMKDDSIAILLVKIDSLESIQSP